MTSPAAQGRNDTTKTMAELQRVSGASNKPNYCLAIKVTNQGDRIRGRRIRTTLYNRLIAIGWQTPNTTSSWLYYRRDPRTQDQFEVAETQAIDTILGDMKQQGHQNYTAGSWQVRWMFVKPLKETGTRADFRFDEFFAEPDGFDEAELAPDSQAAAAADAPTADDL